MASLPTYDQYVQENAFTFTGSSPRADLLQTPASSTELQATPMPPRFVETPLRQPRSRFSYGDTKLLFDASPLYETPPNTEVRSSLIPSRYNPISSGLGRRSEASPLYETPPSTEFRSSSVPSRFNPISSGLGRRSEASPLYKTPPSTEFRSSLVPSSFNTISSGLGRRSEASLVYETPGLRNVTSRKSFATQLTDEVCRDVKKIELENIDLDDITTLASKLRKCINLVELHIDFNSDTVQYEKNNIMMLFLEIQACTSLAQIHISGTPISDGESTVLGFVIRNLSTTLTHLTVRNSTLKDTDIVNLISGLRQCAQLKFLDLSNNKIGIASVYNLHACLKDCKTVEHLDLSNNSIGNKTVTDGLELKLFTKGKFPVLHLDNNTPFWELAYDTVKQTAGYLKDQYDSASDIYYENPMFNADRYLLAETSANTQIDMIARMFM